MHPPTKKIKIKITPGRAQTALVATAAAKAASASQHLSMLDRSALGQELADRQVRTLTAEAVATQLRAIAQRFEVREAAAAAGVRIMLAVEATAAENASAEPAARLAAADASAAAARQASEEAAAVVSSVAQLKWAGL